MIRPGVRQFHIDFCSVGATCYKRNPCFEPITLNDAIRVIGDAVGVTPEIQHGPARVGDQRHTQADTTKARLAFGFRPTIGPAAGLRAQADWQRASRTGATSAPR